MGNVVKQKAGCIQELACCKQLLCAFCHGCSINLPWPPALLADSILELIWLMYYTMESHVCNLFARQDWTEIDSPVYPWRSELLAKLHGRDTH